MVGSGLKKYAQENNMTVSRGVAYGVFHGFGATFSEGSGYKRVDISTRFADMADRDSLRGKLNQVDLKRTYRVQQIEFSPRSINIVFQDNPGTMKKLRAFMDWFMPMLAASSATRTNICSECGCEILNGGCWSLVDGVAHRMHAACKEKVKQELAAEAEERKQADTGNYVSGAVGAFLGAVLGAVAWAAVLLVGYVASIVGFLIGFLAEKGYNLFKGKQGKGKVVILALAVILGVIMGVFLADGVSLAQMIGAGELPGIGYGDIPDLILFLLVEDSEYMLATLGNIGMGLLFAALGVFGLLRKAKNQVSDVRILDL